MKKTIMGILVDKRTNEAVEVQRILTEHGCIIDLRVGHHEAAGTFCSEEGLIILHLVGSDEEIQILHGKLNALSRVRAKIIELSFD